MKQKPSRSQLSLQEHVSSIKRAYRLFRSKPRGTVIAALPCAITFVLALVFLFSRDASLFAHNIFSRATAHPASARTPARVTTLTFSDRVAYQRSIEEIYWSHRLWPKENGQPKPPLDEVMSQAEIENKVKDYLTNSQLLEQYWQKPITPDQLQAEMDRMAQHTKQPEVLREIFAALGNDPLIIAECLARPTLAQRQLTNLYSHDPRLHGELKRRAEADLAAHARVEEMKRTSATYTELEWHKIDNDASLQKQNVGRASRLPDKSAGGAPALQQQGTTNAVTLNSAEWSERIEELAASFDTPAEQIPLAKLSNLQENDAAYYVSAVIAKSKDKLKLATIVWQKQPFESWRTTAAAQLPVVMLAAPVSADYTLPIIGAPAAASCTDDTWTATSTTNAPTARINHTAVWTGSEMIVWGGSDRSGDVNSGGRYNPSTDSWTPTSTFHAPPGRAYHTVVWTGSEMIVWGGINNNSPFFLDTGGRYNPSTDSWLATSTTNAPLGRDHHTAVWTGGEMIVWGGQNRGANLNTGGRYNPSIDSWTATGTTNAPTARDVHTAVWTGSEMIVWAGVDGSPPTGLTNTGGRYNPFTDSWTATSTTNAPTARSGHTTVWSGSEMIVWGGSDPSSFFNTGGRYNPSIDSWTATSTTNAPTARLYHTAVWSGNEMIVWGGNDDSADVNTGGRYDPGTDSWTSTSVINAPFGRSVHTAVWSGTQMIVWGGDNDFNFTNTGGRYCAQGGPTPTPTPTPTPAPVVVNVSVSTGTVAEGGSAIYTVHAKPAPTQNTTVNYSMSGTATQGTDYILNGTPGQVTIAAGKTAGKVKLKATIDHVTEDTETAIMTLQPGSGYTVGPKNQATISITDSP